MRKNPQQHGSLSKKSSLVTRVYFNKAVGNKISTKTPGFALSLEKREDVSLADWALHVADDGAVGVVEELHAHLSNKRLVS